MLYDVNRGIALIDYDDRGKPVRIQFMDGSVTDYVYAADGRRLRTRHQTAVEGLTVSVNTSHELTASETLSKDSTDYIGNFRLNGNTLTRYEFGGGYATYLPNATFQGFHFYVRNHQGSVVAVIGDGSADQRTRYYPFGGLFVSECDGEDVNQNKFNGKELDRMHGLDWYDYGARQYDPVYNRFNSMDPLCEKYPHLSPYAYCGNDPVNFVDPDGRDYFVIIDEMNKTMTITANYYAMGKDMNALNHALDFWNRQSYEIDGYTVGFDLKAMELPSLSSIGRRRDEKESDDIERRFNLFLQIEDNKDMIELQTENYMRRNNIFYIGTKDDPNENGHTNGRIIKITPDVENELTGAHEVGHTLGFIHDEYGLMTPESSSPNRCGFISKKQVGIVINNAKNNYRYESEENKNVGFGYVRHIIK